MSTRATYQIGNSVFYCHWDGYPTGAAQRFANMIAALTVCETERTICAIQERRGGLTFAFIRGNMDAEPTEGHDAHGDTEWRYTVSEDQMGCVGILVEEVAWDRTPDRRPWKMKYCGDIADWLNDQRVEYVKMLKRHHARAGSSPENVEAEALEAIPVIVRMEVERDYGTGDRLTYEYATLEEAIKIKHQEALLAGQLEDDNPNKAGHIKRMRAWSEAIKKFQPETVETAEPAHAG